MFLVKGEIVFVVVVAFLLVLIVGAVTFTDVVDNGLTEFKRGVAQFFRGTDAKSHQ